MRRNRPDAKQIIEGPLEPGKVGRWQNSSYSYRSSSPDAACATSRCRWKEKITDKSTTTSTTVTATLPENPPISDKGFGGTQGMKSAEDELGGAKRKAGAPTMLEIPFVADRQRPVLGGLYGPDRPSGCRVIFGPGWGIVNFPAHRRVFTDGCLLRADLVLKLFGWARVLLSTIIVGRHRDGWPSGCDSPALMTRKPVDHLDSVTFRPSPGLIGGPRFGLIYGGASDKPFRARRPHLAGGLFLVWGRS